MRKQCSRHAVLWDLLQPIPDQPRWSNLPLEVRLKTTRLLARLLREHQARGRSAAQRKEAGDE